jgi:DNA-binding CsgD family transcriptional regulator
MNVNILQTLIEDVRDEPNIEVFWDRISSALAPYGVTSMFYGAIASKAEAQLGTKTKNMILKGDHPQEYVDHFGLDNLVDNCKTFEHALKETTPCIWHDERYWDDSTPEQWKQALIEREMGLYFGFTLPTTYFQADNFGAHGISMAELDEKEFRKIWSEKHSEITRILGVMDTGMRQNYLGQIVKLSPREKETLEWLSAGLTPQQIADYLNISTSTIDKYIVGAKKKLNARTRDHAVTKALLLNIIHP